MHPLVRQIGELFLPELERLASQMREQFPALTFNVWHSPTGALTEYQGWDVGLECVIPQAGKDAPDNVAVMIGLCHLNSRARIMAEVVWGHPSGHPEVEFRDNCLTNADWPEAKPETIEEIKEFLPAMFQAFESAVERGVPSA